MSAISRRIERQAKVRDLVKLLGEKLPPTDVQSLLLDAYRLRSESVKPRELVTRWRTNRFTGSSSLDARAFLRWDGIAFSELPSGYSAVDLSPVCPLGTVAAVTGLSQDWMVTTSRNTDVVSDPTSALALEYASRRTRARNADPVKLAATHRVLRAQKYANPKSLAHFRMFSLCSGGRDRGNLEVEIAEVSEHVDFYLRALQRYLGSGIVLATSFTELGQPSHLRRWESELVTPLRLKFPGVEFSWDAERKSGREYYRSLCFHIYASHPDGRPRELVDGGDVDWAAKLLGNGKERLVASAIGTEGLCAIYGEEPTPGAPSEP